MMKDLEVVSMLGSCYGTSGVVLLALKNARLVALKKIDLEHIDVKTLGDIQRELYLARQLSHANILSIESSFVDSHCLYIMTTAAGYGSCADLVTNHFQEGLGETALALILKDVCQGLNYLHSKKYMHRAIRGRHILVTSAGRAMLTCLRFAESIVPGSVSHVFSETDSTNLNFLSPEILAQDADGYDQKSDIYSIGMTILELINAVPPFSDMSATCMLVQKLGGWVPSFTRDVSVALGQVRDACTRQDPNLRPTALQLLSLPFFKVKGDLRNLLHPVIPMESHQVQADSDDLRAIMLNSHKMADISIDPVDWNFD